MKVILIQDVKSLGKEGEVVEVSDGHAQNFLFPQNMGVPATPETMKKRVDAEKMQARDTHKELSVTGDLATQLEGHELILKEKISDGGVLYAAVTEKAIASALKKDGFKVDSKMIKLETPIKEPGTHTVTVELPLGFEAQILVTVEEK
ncbi:MAG: 50S ribosomal protein L9 [Parcubacteria group bacterium]|nr:50S ribosomal protein L9 [Parcubacteria group bacterium]